MDDCSFPLMNEEIGGRKIREKLVRNPFIEFISHRVAFRK